MIFAHYTQTLSIIDRERNKALRTYRINISMEEMDACSFDYFKHAVQAMNNASNATLGDLEIGGIYYEKD